MRLKKAQPLDSAFLNSVGENGPVPLAKLKKQKQGWEIQSQKKWPYLTCCSVILYAAAQAR